MNGESTDFQREKPTLVGRKSNKVCLNGALQQSGVNGLQHKLNNQHSL